MLHSSIYSILLLSFLRILSLSNGDVGLVPSINSTEEICPFPYFKITHKDFEHEEVGNKAEIIAEISYWGEQPPFGADLRIEYEASDGISLKIKSSKEKGMDQILLRKVIQVKIFLSDSMLNNMRQNSSNRNGSIGNVDKARNFSIKISPSHFNEHCLEDGFIENNQINIPYGCHPSVLKWIIRKNVSTISQEKIIPLESANPKYDISIDGNVFYFPRDKVSYRQRKRFGCSEVSADFCKIPFANKVKDNVFSVNHRDEIIPFFDQIIPKLGARNVTGNVLIYDVLGENIDTNTTYADAGCISKESNWYENLMKRIHEDKSDNKSNTIDANLYDLYKDCFQGTESTPREELMEIKYRIFNQTNMNALKFSRERDRIHILRAVVVNMDSNRFTFCHRLDAYFLFRVTGVLTRLSIAWYIYLALLLAILGLLLISYLIFYGIFDWKSKDKDELLEKKRLREMERKLVEAHLIDIKENKESTT